MVLRTWNIYDGCRSKNNESSHTTSMGVEETMGAYTILFIEPNPHFLRAATHLFQQYYTDELAIVGTLDGGSDIFHQVRTLQPCIVLLDLDRHYLESLHLISQLRAEQPEVGIIALSSHALYDYRQAALSAGAHAFVAKDDLNHALLPAVWHITGTPPTRRQSVDASSCPPNELYEPHEQHDQHDITYEQ